MKLQPNRDYISNDNIMTPVELTKKIVEYFNPTGKILEPCKGNGNFMLFLPNADWCEITEGKDFFDYHEKVDWIITNPPWSQFKRFLEHSLDLANNIVFLITVNHLWTKSRMRLIGDKNFGINSILLIETPKEFPSTGFQLGVIYLKKNYQGKTEIRTI